jgi:hypothetical protein
LDITSAFTTPGLLDPMEVYNRDSAWANPFAQEAGDGTRVWSRGFGFSLVRHGAGVMPNAVKHRGSWVTVPVEHEILRLRRRMTP